MSWVAKQNGPIKYTFALSPFCFSLSSFPSWSLITIISCPSSSPWTSHLLHHLVCTNLAHDHTWWHRLVLRFHQLSKTKLGLSEGQFAFVTLVKAQPGTCARWRRRRRWRGSSSTRPLERGRHRLEGRIRARLPPRCAALHLWGQRPTSRCLAQIFAETCAEAKLDYADQRFREAHDRNRWNFWLAIEDFSTKFIYNLSSLSYF